MIQIQTENVKFDQLRKRRKNQIKLLESENRFFEFKIRKKTFSEKKVKSHRKRMFDCQLDFTNQMWLPMIKEKILVSKRLCAIGYSISFRDALDFTFLQKKYKIEHFPEFGWKYYNLKLI